MGEQMFVETQTLRHISIDEEEEAENNDTDPESQAGEIYPHDENKNAEQGSVEGDRLSAGQSSPSAHELVPTPPKMASQVIGPDLSPAVPSLASPIEVASSLPASTALTFSRTTPGSPAEGSGLPIMKVPAPPCAPAPPPLPFRWKTHSRKPRTKAFHWDVVGSEKVTLSFCLTCQ